MIKRYSPDDPREWLSRARTNLALAKSALPDVHLEELCFNAHQAAEKAIKGVFISRHEEFPYTHDLRKLLELARQRAMDVPEPVCEAERLTPYAFEFRYPGFGNVSEDDYRYAVAMADAVLHWAEGIILGAQA
jgi:HEPN domain-containing protein